MKRKLKLFIWTHFSPDWTDGLAFAIAEDEIEARELVKKQHGNHIYDWGDLEMREINKKVARSVAGGG